MRRHIKKHGELYEKYALGDLGTASRDERTNRRLEDLDSKLRRTDLKSDSDDPNVTYVCALADFGGKRRIKWNADTRKIFETNLEWNPSDGLGREEGYKSAFLVRAIKDFRKRKREYKEFMKRKREYLNSRKK